MWVYFNVDFRYAPSHVIDVVRDALRAAPIEGVADDPKPNVICYDFAKDGRDSFGYYAVRYWLTDLANDDPTSSRVRTRIYTALRRAGIPLARPAQTPLRRAERGTRRERDEAPRGARLHRARPASSSFTRSPTEERGFVVDAPAATRRSRPARP